MKKQYKIYLDPGDYSRLEKKAQELFKGRGCVSRYIEKISQEKICFLDSNLRAMIEVLKLQPSDRTN